MSEAEATTHAAGRTIWSIHYLRALAAIGVLVFHSATDNGWQFEFGAEGIHLFFTISGFMMWSIAAARPVRPAAFLRGRVRRIVPLYWLATATAVASIWIMPGFFWQATTDPIVIAKSLLFIPQFGPEGGIFPVLYQGWTLQYEMYFYLVFAACLLVAAERRLILLTLWFVAVSIIGIALKPTGQPVLFSYTDPICLEFLGGVFAARCAHLRLDPRIAGPLAVAAAAGFFVADANEKVLGLFSPLVIASMTSTLVWSLVVLEREGKVPQWRPFRLLGEASYATYLFQTVGFAFAEQIPEGIALRSVFYVIAALCVGIAVHLGIETRLARSQLLRRRLPA